MDFDYLYRSLFKETSQEGDDDEMSSIDGRVESVGSPTTHQKLSSQATLVDLLVEAFPDSSIQAPKIVIVGSQSSGKTKLIISMILQRLNSHPKFTDAMGDTLLKVFRTGRGLTTRRPVVVNLLHTSDQEVCTIRFSYDTDTYDFGESRLDHFLDSLNNYDGNEIFESALEITIKAFQLPNIQFTDMPGLRSTDVELKNAVSALTLNDLVEKCISNPSNTIVAVETASQFAHGEDVALLPRLLRKVQEKDPSVVGRSLMVLTMCDKIVPATFIQDTLPTIEGESRSTYASYFTDIVCVSNKIDGQKEPHEVSFAEFRQIFEETKRQELTVFKDRGNISTTERCTTEAVFQKIDSVFKLLLDQALQTGKENLQKIANEVKRELRRGLAPPAHLYTDNDSCQAGQSLFSKQMLLQEINETAKSCMTAAIEDMQLFADADPNFETKATLLQTRTGVAWPVSFKQGDISSGLQRRAYFKKALHELKTFESDVLHKVDQMFMDPSNGVFVAKNSPFHRIHRFPNLQARLRERFVSIGGNACQFFHDKLESYLRRMWENEEPTGQLTVDRVVDIMENARHLFLIDCHEYLDEKLTGTLIDLTEVNLLKEADDFVQRRQELNKSYEGAELQKKYLSECLDLQNDSEKLMARIQEAIRTLKILKKQEPTNEWEQAFWEEGYRQYRQSLLSVPPSVASSQQLHEPPPQQHHVSFATAAACSLFATTSQQQSLQMNKSESSSSASASSTSATTFTTPSLPPPTNIFIKHSPDTAAAAKRTSNVSSFEGTQMEEDETEDETHIAALVPQPNVAALPDIFHTCRSPPTLSVQPRNVPSLSDSETSDSDSDSSESDSGDIDNHEKKRSREGFEGPREGIAEGPSSPSEIPAGKKPKPTNWSVSSMFPTSIFGSKSPPPTTRGSTDDRYQPNEESKSTPNQALPSHSLRPPSGQRQPVPLGLPAPPATQTPSRDAGVQRPGPGRASATRPGRSPERGTFSQLQQMVHSSQPQNTRTPPSKDELVDLT